MRTRRLIPIAGLFLLSACNTAEKPNAANFTAAINQYLAKHGDACTIIGRLFPIDVPRSERSDVSGLESKLAVMEQAGLLRETDTTAVVHAMLEPLRGPTPPQPVRHYEHTAEGTKYVRQIPSALGQTNALCYGQEVVGAISNWTLPPTGPNTQADVTYTYKIVNLAEWAQRSDVQRAFPDIGATIAAASKMNQTIGVQLTNQGWTVPQP